MRYVLIKMMNDYSNVSDMIVYVYVCLPCHVRIHREAGSPYTPSLHWAPTHTSPTAPRCCRGPGKRHRCSTRPGCQPHALIDGDVWWSQPLPWGSPPPYPLLALRLFQISFRDRCYQRVESEQVISFLTLRVVSISHYIDH